MRNKDKITQLLKRDTFFMQIMPAFVVFLALLAFALGSWQNSVRSQEAQHQKAVEQRVLLATNHLEERMKATESLLRAGNGLLFGSDVVTNQEWQRFYEKLSGVDDNVGATVIGYTPIVAAAERANFEEALRRDGNATGVNTVGAPALMAPVLYATQFGGEAITIPYGQDLYAEPIFKEVMDAARDSGEASMTDVIKAGSSNTQNVVIFMPVYADGLPTGTVVERREALVGFICGLLDTNKVLSSLIDEKNEEFGFTVKQTDNPKLSDAIYQSSNIPKLEDNRAPADSVTFNEYGHAWQFDFFAEDSIVALNERTKPGEILAIGIGLAVIASSLTYFLLKYRTKIFAIAEEQKLQQAKDELLSLASHQLRTPATGVKQYVGMVLDGFGGPVPKQQVKLLEQAYKSNERQLQIINEFLYVAKLGSGSLITSKHKFDLAPLVRDVIEEMEIDIKEKHHVVRAKIPKNLPLKADEHSVRMITENLLSNAIKYTQPGGKIDVEVRQGNREVVVTVRDNGVGIAKKDQKHLFKQFSRIPNELTNEVSGSGIGLYLAQQLAVRNGGRITVESEPARGSTFTLSLPNWRVKKITIPKRST